MDIHHYLLEPDQNDWATLLSCWSDALPARFTFWFANRFGDVFLVFENGSINMLRVDSGELHRLADGRDHFSQLIDVADNANDWLVIPLVQRCVASGIAPAAHQCYGFKIPPILGGAFTADNIAAINIDEYYAFLVEVRRQTKNLADGTPIRLRVSAISDTVE